MGRKWRRREKQKRRGRRPPDIRMRREDWERPVMDLQDVNDV